MAGLLILVAPALAAAQAGAPGARQDDASTESRPPRVAAPYLEPGHWMPAALRRMEALGLLPGGYDPAMWATDRAEAARLTETALSTARSARPELVPLIQSYLDRFRREYPASHARALGAEGGWGWGAASLAAGVSVQDGEVWAALGQPDFPQAPAEVRPGEEAALLGVDVSGYGGDRLAGRLHVEAVSDDVELREAYLAAAWAGLRWWAGRRPIRLGPGTDAVVLAGSSLVDGAGFDTNPFRLPWVLDALGPVQLKTYLGRLGYVAPHDQPWLWAVRGSVQPHARLTLGVNRATMVATSEDYDFEWFKQVLYGLVGKHPEGELNREDNQIVSVDVRYRPPLGAFPLALYMEWGFEDSAGAWRSVPGIVAGAHAPAIPTLPWLALGVEGASFAESCCGNPWWYRHRGFAGGWTDDRVPLAHGLGGEGRELAVTADAALLDARLLLGTRLYQRDRGEENLFAPVLEGISTGFAVRASALPWGSFRLELEGEHESGPGQNRTLLYVKGAYFF